MNYALNLILGTCAFLCVGLCFSAYPATDGTAIAAKCPYGNATPSDGCSELYASGLQGTVQFPDAFTNPLYGPGSGQSYFSRLQENQAGVDFPTGLPQRYAGKLKDPMTNPPENCTPSLTGSAAKGPKLTCSSGPITIHGYQFGPIGGHPATVLHVNNTVTSEDIQYNEFSNDWNTSTSSNMNDYALFLAAPGSTFNSVFSHNTVNGKCSSASCGLNYQVVAYTSGSKTWDYNAWLWMPVRITAGCAGPCATIGDLNLRWSIVMGHDMTSALHGEWIEDIFAQSGTPTVQSHTNYIGNVSIQPATAAPNSTANIYVSGGAAPVGPPTYSDVQITDSTLICNKNSGKNICSSIIDFQNGIYSNVHLANLAVDATGSIGTFRADCGHTAFTGSIAADGTLTVSGSRGGLLNANPSAGASKLWYGGAPSGISLTSQLSGTPGKDGTYATTARGDISSRAMVGYGGRSTASFPSGVTMLNVQNMLEKAPRNLITSFNYKNGCLVLAPP